MMLTDNLVKVRERKKNAEVIYSRTKTGKFKTQWGHTETNKCVKKIISDE